MHISTYIYIYIYMHRYTHYGIPPVNFSKLTGYRCVFSVYPALNTWKWRRSGIL